MNNLKHDKIRVTVRKAYGKIATSDKPGCGCSDSGCCGPREVTAEAMSQALGYSAEDVNSVPKGANMGLGCGNPQAIANLKVGEVVLDLGSGGGFDCFLAARQVGETGHVIGIDMTPEMISKARANAEEGGDQNVEFRLGEIENLPVADGIVDVVISNCVINLSPNKQRVFSETFRVLKNGGRLAVSDVVAFGELPEEIRQDMAQYTGCVAGASPIKDIEEMLKVAGYEQISIVPKDESKAIIREWAPGVAITDYVISAAITAVKP